MSSAEVVQVETGYFPFLTKPLPLKENTLLQGNQKRNFVNILPIDQSP